MHVTKVRYPSSNSSRYYKFVKLFKEGEIERPSQGLVSKRSHFSLHNKNVLQINVTQFNIGYDIAALYKWSSSTLTSSIFGSPTPVLKEETSCYHIGPWRATFKRIKYANSWWSIMEFLLSYEVGYYPLATLGNYPIRLAITLCFFELVVRCEKIFLVEPVCSPNTSGYLGPRRQR